jgi:hypothetical protein
MSAKKRTADDGGVAVLGAPRSRRGMRWAISGLLLVAIGGGASLAVWQHVSGHVLSGSQYQVLLEHIQITPPPEWIMPDEGSDDSTERIKLEVLRDVGRTGPLSLLDEDLTVRMATAFLSHPWVARVDRVSKHYPAGIEVSLAYRVPVAMVDMHDGSGVLPVDEHSVVLPTRDFTAEQAQRYPRIAEIYTTPSGPVGTRWSDAAVLGAAQVAAALAEDWHKLGFDRIVPVERKPAKTGFEYTYAVITKSGTTIFWGRAPGTDVPGEVPATEKLTQLKRYAAQNGGTLDGPDGPQQIEIDQRGALLRKARPVIEPLPGDEAPAGDS